MGKLKVPKPEPLDLDERDQHRMYRARVLEGDLFLVPMGPILWGPIVGSVVGEGLQVVVNNVAKFVEDVVGGLVDSVLEDAIKEMTIEVACEVCFK
jgi:hypothetical protein